MAKINQALLARLTAKLGVSTARVYALIQEISAKYSVPRHLGALLLAGANGISQQKYATEDQLAELRGVRNHVTATAEPPRAAAAAPALVRRGKAGRPPKTKENTVFVVHGRDVALRSAMYEFLGALGLRPLEWGHAIRAAKGGNPYVNDAVAKVMEQAQAIVILLSADDEAKLKDQFVGASERQTEGKLRGQARPNVIFETGIAVGTHHRKTVMVRVGDVKPFSDVGGMHIPRLGDDAASRNEIANRLEALGCRTDREGDHWLHAGNFTPTPPKARRKKTRKRTR